MSAHRFRSVFMVATVAGAALGCYLVSLRVASERASLENVETKIVLAQRDIRLLQTEIGTRGRLAQLERWNVKVLALSAPSADQFVENGFTLATLVKPAPKDAVAAPVVLASAPAPIATSPIPPVSDDDADTGAATQAPRRSQAASDMLHTASFTRPERPATLAQPPRKLTVPTQPAPAAASNHAVAKPATKPVKTATADPLAPLPHKALATKEAPAKLATHHTKDTGPTR